MMAKIKIIEHERVRAGYDMLRQRMIIDHPRHGRLLVVEGWGGNEIEGECYRWKHGEVVQLLPGDTFASLTAISGNLDDVLCGYDATRPVLDWPGFFVARLARAADAPGPWMPRETCAS